MHTAQIEKFAAAEAEEAAKPSANGSARSDEPAAGGSLASDAQLAALREKLAGSA
jgi:small subunit ribosomal protein S1